MFAKFDQMFEKLKQLQEKQHKEWNIIVILLNNINIETPYPVVTTFIMIN